jgi:putative hydrolase of the HAD superfamily
LEIRAVIFDYGCVISLSQVKQEIDAMLDLIGIKEDIFTTNYYKYRLEYDSGISGEEYWGKVLSACHVNYDREMIIKLIEHDAKSWIAINQEVLDLAKDLKNHGYKLGIISNMPMDILKYMKENFPWLKNNLFDTTVFSCDLKVCKPDLVIYTKCLERLHLRPAECLFIDDVEANIQAAQKLGLETFHYRNPEALEVLRRRLLKNKSTR